jgi:hypothetical protein
MLPEHQGHIAPCQEFPSFTAAATSSRSIWAIFSQDMGPSVLRVCWFNATNLLRSTTVSGGSSTVTEILVVGLILSFTTLSFTEFLSGRMMRPKGRAASW